MGNETLSFWWERPGLASALLAPVAMGYGFFARRNMESRVPPKIDLPVLCIGNFTLGGAGKTPVTIAFAQAARKIGRRPGIVTRGFGGTVRGVHLVDGARDRAREVGDEPLLLAKHARVAVAADRYAGAQTLKDSGCNMILMDDGFQSRRLYPDYSLLVVDALRGVGNGRIFPAGPLRAPLATQLAYTDAVLIIGQGEGRDAAVRFAARAAKSVYHAVLRPCANKKAEGKRFLAFAGIGNPQKFFAGIEELGGIVEQRRIFADHHFFNEYDIKDIVESARAHKLALATTAKDYVRLKTDGLNEKLAGLVVFDVDVAFERPGFCETVLSCVSARYKERQLL